MNNRLLELAQEAEQSANLGNAIDIRLMMSKERELLEKVIQDVDDGVMSVYLYKEVMDYLAQPEHTAEPVAWYWEGCDLDDPEWIAMADTGDKPIEDRCKRNIQPLYLAPQKREPLSEEAVGELLMSGFSTELMDLVRMIEKEHGIGI